MNVTTCWHRSHTIYSFKSTYPYNVVKDFFWRAYKGEFNDWIKVDNFKVVNHELAAEMSLKGNGRIVYKKQTITEPTTITCFKSNYGNHTVFNVVLTGDPAKSVDKLKNFFNILHKEVRFEKYTRRYIFSEQFIKFNEIKEKVVCQALEMLFRLFGISDNVQRVKKPGGILHYRKDTTIFLFGESKIRVKCYRPKKFNFPAKGVSDQPKLEVTVYYEKSSLKKEELEKFGRDLIATIAEYADLYEDIVPSSLHFNYEESGNGYSIPSLFKSMKAESLKWKIEGLEAVKKELFHPKSRKIALKLTDGPKTAKQLSEELGIPPRTVSYHLQKLRKSKIIYSFTNKRHRYYGLNIWDNHEQ